MMSNIPALIRLPMVFILIIVCIRKKVSLGNIFLFASLFMGLLFELAPIAMLKSMLNSVLYFKTLALAVIVSLILVLSNSMEITGQMKLLLNNFKGLIRNPKVNLIVFPALIGLLPMPGGAVFSAPMVKEMGNDSSLSPARLSFVNYWFRHIWEYWWPLYPGVLLVTFMADIHLAMFILFMSPLTLIAIASGYILLKEYPAEATSASVRPPLKPFIKEILPILIVIIPGLGMGVLLSYAFPEFKIAKETGLIIALAASIAWVWQVHQVSPQKARQIAFNTQILKMIYMVFAILIFKGIMEDSHAVEAITKELTLLNIPLILIVAILPMIVGIISGITIAFVGSTFPILIPLIGSLDPGTHLLPYMMLGLVCGFVGVMMSPVHLCLILSNEYFHARLESVYKYLWGPCLYITVAGIVYFYILKVFF